MSLYRVENFHFKGSIAHGIAINELIGRIDTKYGVMMDADFTFLYRNWDEILINELNEKFPIIGTQAPQGYGSKKYGDFPLMYGILFYTDVLKNLQIDFRPKKIIEGIDTGYQLKEKFIEKGYQGKLLINKNTRQFKLGPFRNIICEEFYLHGIKEIFASHFGRGSHLGRMKYKFKKEIGKEHKIKVLYSIPIFGKYFLKIKGKRQMKKWIKICKKIVNEI